MNLVSREKAIDVAIDEYNRGYKEGFEAGKASVSVVRCKDCKHWTRIYTKWHCDIHFNVGHAEFYCADGERKEDAEIH